MGYAIAEAALAAGHDVTLISGPVNLGPPPSAQFVSIMTSDEMYGAVHRHARECDVLVMCAAVADYKPRKVSATKIKKRNAHFALDLVPTRDILASLPHKNRQFLLVGFAAETNDIEENAKQKLRAKNCDIIVANDVSSADSGMESDDKRSHNLLSQRRKRKNFARIKKNYRAQARKNINKLREKNV